MALPYFTVQDPGLVRTIGGRDPLGLLPVWSTIGRGLVPNLASPIAQVDGIISVMLIHWLCQFPLRDKLPDVSGKKLRPFFRLMEGLLEYHLWKTSGTISYGTRALGALEDEFEITADDGRSVANGLYQFYRGTCRRAFFRRRPSGKS